MGSWYHRPYVGMAQKQDTDGRRATIIAMVTLASCAYFSVTRN